MERPKVDVPNMVEQIRQIQTVIAKTTKPFEPQPVVSISDEAYAKLMAPCTNPSSNPSGGDL